MLTTHTIELRVRYVECDPMGLAHHGSYLPWFEMGRTELLRASGVRYANLEASGYLLVVAKLAVKFRRPAKYDDVLQLTTTVAGASRVKVEHGYELSRAGEVLCVASSTLGCVTREGTLRMMPPWLAGPALAATPALPASPAH